MHNPPPPLCTLIIILPYMPKCDIQKLQRIQSIAAKMILRRRKYDSVTACLKELHWLPVALRIEFKILTVVTFANVVGRMLCIHPRLSVCLFVCLLAGLLKKLWTDLNEI